MKLSNKDRKTLHDKKNVVGVGIGTKYSNGIDTGEECVVVLVSKKTPLIILHSGDRVPKTIGSFRNNKTDVLEVGNILPLQKSHKKKHRPLVGGVSGAPKGFNFSGTIGLPLIYQDEQPMMLSNAHVFAPYWENYSLTEEEIKTQGIYIGTPILQPSTMDKFGNKDAVGTLWAWKEFKLDVDNFFDAAIAKVSVEALPELLGLGGYTKIIEPKVGMKVKKSGRTSEVTESKISITDLTVGVAYPGFGTINFKNQIGFVPGFTSPGDSGSAVVNDKNELVGLIFAGGANFSVGSPLNEIFKYFRLKLSKPKEKEEKPKASKIFTVIFELILQIVRKLFLKKKERD